MEHTYISCGCLGRRERNIGSCFRPSHRHVTNGWCSISAPQAWTLGMHWLDRRFLAHREGDVPGYFSGHLVVLAYEDTHHFFRCRILHGNPSPVWGWL